MPVYHCANCDAPLTLDEWDAGTCPSCQRPVDRPGRRGPGTRRATDISFAADLSLSSASLLGWAAVRAGLLLVGSGAIVALAAHLVWQFTSVDVVEPNVARGPRWVEPLARVDPFLVTLRGMLETLRLAGLTAVILGTWLCCPAPAEAGARGWAIAAVAMQVAAGLTMFLIALLTAPMQFVRIDPAFLQGPRPTQVMNYVVYGVLILAVAFFACFLARVAGYLRARGLRTSLFVFLGITLLTNLIFLVLYVLQAQGILAPFLGRTLFWIRLSFYTPLLIWFIVQTFLLRSVLTEMIARSWAEE